MEIGFARQGLGIITLIAQLKPRQRGSWSALPRVGNEKKGAELGTLVCAQWPEELFNANTGTKTLTYTNTNNQETKNTQISIYSVKWVDWQLNVHKICSIQIYFFIFWRELKGYNFWPEYPAVKLYFALFRDKPPSHVNCTSLKNLTWPSWKPQ